MGDAAVERVAKHLSLDVEWPVVAEVVPETERNRRQQKPGGANPPIRHVVVALREATHGSWVKGTSENEESSAMPVIVFPRDDRHSGWVGLLIRLVELLIVIVPLAGVIIAGLRAVSRARARQDDAPTDEAPSRGSDQTAQWQAIKRTTREHDRTETRWLDYELDVGKLLDYPLMTDMRDPLTQRFHRAKLRADFLRPADAADLLGDADVAREYRDAVEEYVTAFDVAEAEAIRRRQSDFSRADQQRLARAKRALRIVSDPAATPQERERAYDVARRELDGLIVLPERTRVAIEHGIAGELDS